eukprot:scaffold1903_cov396-Prasinococcus_capsulatus_cf.AAC.17
MAKRPWPLNPNGVAGSSKCAWGPAPNEAVHARAVPKRESTTLPTVPDVSASTGRAWLSISNHPTCTSQRRTILRCRLRENTPQGALRSPHRFAVQFR